MISAQYVLPLIVCVLLITALIKRVDAFTAFAEGGKDGIKQAVALLPVLMGMIVGITVLRASGALEAATSILGTLLPLSWLPADLLPLFFIRPLSGAASLGIVQDLTAYYGPEHFIAQAAAVIQGSTDTTLYVLTIYFGAIGIRTMGRALAVGLLADAAGMLIAVLVTIWYFGY